MFLTKTSSTPVLVALTCTLLLAKISSGQMHEEYEILGKWGSCVVPFLSSLFHFLQSDEDLTAAGDAF